MKKMILGLCLASSLIGTLLFAEDAPAAAAAAPQSNLYQTLMMIGIAVLFFYFILYRPEQKRRKALETTRNSLKKGDRATAMGIIGTVVRVQDNSVILKMVDGSKIEMLKAAITDVQPGTEEDSKTVEAATAN
ncbi:MAG: preprotein translocase subunit YajC [Verrucomicrobia bacterium]|nr:preprotein translocase subunit YajC [Verrucomicrobiota bacterium]